MLDRSNARVKANERIAGAPGSSLNREVQLQFQFDPRRSPSDELPVSGKAVPMIFVRNRRARRYILRLRADGVARVTVPRGGSIAEARQFAQRNTAWIERELDRLAERRARPREWLVGGEIHFRGELTRLEPCAPGEGGTIRLGGEIIPTPNCDTNIRGSIERHLWGLAARELPPKVFAFAATHGLAVNRVTVRNQRSRWGSCSRRGTISLNWRLIQTPEFVQDYLILHELMHLRQMNHSARFWREVESVCPNYRTAEKWLKEHGELLR